MQFSAYNLGKRKGDRVFSVVVPPYPEHSRSGVGMQVISIIQTKLVFQL